VEFRFRESEYPHITLLLQIMILTDTHTHLYADAFDEDRHDKINEAIDAGIKRFFLPAIDSETTESMKQLKGSFPDNVFLMSGLHPTHVKEDWKYELKVVKKELDSGSYVAVGEIGMDLYWDKTFHKQQEQAFHNQIQLAMEYELPIVIHCREAFDEVFTVLESYQDTSLHGIFHCFTGNREQAERAMDLNMLLGIGGVVTFKNGGVDKFLADLPLEKIVLETDAPYLAPSPYRGKRNVPIYLLQVLEKVAELYGMPVAKIADITTQNSKRVFGI